MLENKDNLSYIRCSKCGCVSRLKCDEEKKCLYCEADVRDATKASEMEWRKYWIGIFGQPFQLNSIKRTKQLCLGEVRSGERSNG